MSQKSAALRLDWGVALQAQPGQVECGDAWVIEPVANGILVAVIDGLGHGTAAAVAAQRAVETIRRSASLPLEKLISVCHQALLGSRGAAISVARIDTAGETLTWVGVGNVEGLVLNPVAFTPPVWQSEALVARGGVVGYELPTLRPATLPFKPGSFLVFATDGVKPGFAGEMRARRQSQQAADHILAGYGRGTDDALVMVVQLLRGGSHQDS
jgi:negative regulator of sigma-B (phosphoserine phosphatase)